MGYPIEAHHSSLSKGNTVSKFSRAKSKETGVYQNIRHAATVYELKGLLPGSLSHRLLVWGQGSLYSYTNNHHHQRTLTLLNFVDLPSVFGLCDLESAVGYRCPHPLGFKWIQPIFSILSEEYGHANNEGPRKRKWEGHVRPETEDPWKDPAEGRF